MNELSNHEINLKIARMMPGWTEYEEDRTIGNPKYPHFFVAHADGAVMFAAAKGFVDYEEWSPTTDLNQAAQAVRAIIGDDTNCKFYDELTKRGIQSPELLIAAGPRAWCLALLTTKGGDGEA